MREIGEGFCGKSFLNLSFDVLNAVVVVVVVADAFSFEQGKDTEHDNNRGQQVFSQCNERDERYACLSNYVSLPYPIRSSVALFLRAIDKNQRADQFVGDTHRCQRHPAISWGTEKLYYLKLLRFLCVLAVILIDDARRKNCEFAQIQDYVNNTTLVSDRAHLSNIPRTCSL